MNDKDYAAEQIRRSQSKLRRFIKRFYIEEALKSLAGPTLDVGCGAGQILERLPAGSVGLESNPNLVSFLNEKGLPCRHFILSEGFSTASLFKGQKFQSLILSHVLEHFPNAMDLLREILEACGEHRSLKQVLVIVPTERGYSTDATHQTFVSRPAIEAAGLRRTERFSLTQHHFFPLNASWPGSYIAYHELHLLWTRH